MAPERFIAIFFRPMIAAFALLGLSMSAHATPGSSCRESGVSLQVLGSGGPIADDYRASSAYLVWVNGESRFLIDAGGGAFLRFAQARGNFDELEFIGISHFHADHSADLPALLKSGYFAKRTRDLAISGPAGSEPFPGLHDYLDSMIGKDHGAYRYLSGYLDGSGGLPMLKQVEVPIDGATSTIVFSGPDTQVEALPVPHGIVPALAYRVQLDDVSIVFAGDQNGSDERFIEFARDASILVMHMPVPEGIKGEGRKLHAPPSVIGEIATAANAQQLVVSHFMARSVQDLDSNIARIKDAYSLKVTIAEDLSCVNT